MEENNLPQKESVFLLWFLTVITFSIYGAYWYVKNSTRFNNLNTPNKVSRGLAISYFTLTIIYIVASLSIYFMFFSLNSVSDIVDIINMGTSILGLATFVIAIIMAFQARSVINDIWTQKNVLRKVSWFFTLVFNLFYIQYEVNRTLENRELEKRIGPWVCLVLLVIIPVLLVILILTALYYYLNSVGF